MCMYSFSVLLTVGRGVRRRRRPAPAADHQLAHLLGATLFILPQALLGRATSTALLASAVSATGFAMTSPARGAIIPRLLPAELVPAANALNSLVFGFGAIVGPMIAGVLLAWQGFPLAYAVDAVLFTASLYASIRLPQLLPMGEIQRPGWRSVADGLRYIPTGPVLLMSFVVDIIAMVFALPRALFRRRSPSALTARR